MKPICQVGMDNLTVNSPDNLTKSAAVRSPHGANNEWRIEPASRPALVAANPSTAQIRPAARTRGSLHRVFVDLKPAARTSSRMAESGTDTLDRSADRRTRAINGARAAIRALARQGVSARVTGSLATGRFGPGSDVDLLVTDCPRALKYTIESLVEDCLDGIPFDVIYLDEVPAPKGAHILSIAVDASDLR